MLRHLTSVLSATGAEQCACMYGCWTLCMLPHADVMMCLHCAKQFRPAGLYQACRLASRKLISIIPVMHFIVFKARKTD